MVYPLSPYSDENSRFTLNTMSKGKMFLNCICLGESQQLEIIKIETIKKILLYAVYLFFFFFPFKKEIYLFIFNSRMLLESKCSGLVLLVLYNGVNMSVFPGLGRNHRYSRSMPSPLIIHRHSQPLEVRLC